MTRVNESTEFTSQIKTTKYLAVGLRGICTPIKDVFKPYAEEDLIYIAQDAESFIRFGEEKLKKT